jgi:hypothetical protein
MLVFDPKAARLFDKDCAMSLSIQKFLTCSLIVSTMFLALPANAEECEGLGDNPDWQNGMNAIRDAFDKADYDAVLLKGEDLSFICSRSPKLNYYIASAHAAKGSYSDAAAFFEIAGDATRDFETAPDLVQKIYYGRYEAEHPERSEAAVTALTQENESLRKERTLLSKTNESLEKQMAAVRSHSGATPSGDSSDDAARICLTDKLADDKAGLWTGVGVGAGGIVLTIVGSVLVTKMDKYKHTGFHEEQLDAAEAAKYGRQAGSVRVQDYKVSEGYVAGWTLLGAGIAFTVTGAVLSGIYGYKVSHDEDRFALGISPFGASFGMTF